MSSELHQSVWLAYRGSADRATGGSAVTRFQAAVDAILRSFPGVDAPSACREAARMVMMRPRGTRRWRRAERSIAAVRPSAAMQRFYAPV